MIVLESRQILEAIHRSLETHILPALSDEFARVQVQSALKALAEVSDRLENGDPSARSNHLIENHVHELADSIRGDSPEFADLIDTALADQPEDATPRPRGRQLGEALWLLVSRHEGPAAAQLLAILQAEALRTMAEDNQWMCPEAIASLT